MQEKTLEELANETRERIVKECWHKTETGHALDMTGTRELIVEALEKAREEGRKEGYEQGYDQWFLDKDEVVEGVRTQYKEELLSKLNVARLCDKGCKFWGGETCNCTARGFTECLSEVKKLIK